MPPGFSAVLRLLVENPRDKYLEVTSLLLRIANNVIMNPFEPTYRKLNLANPKVAELVQAVGAMECLFEMGFKKAKHILVLQPNSDLEKLKSIHDQILAQRGNFTSVPTTSTSQTSSRADTSNVVDANVVASGSQGVSSLPQPVKITSGSAKTPPALAKDSNAVSIQNSVVSKPQSIKVPKGKFLDGIVSASVVVSSACFKENLQYAKSCIPILQLEVAAIEALRKIQYVIKKEQAEGKEAVSVQPSMQELMLVQLLSWFKEKFFSWVNNPPCQFCSGKTVFKRTTSKPNLRTEVYECALCFQETDFPRYLDVLKLLKTRRGRCGEWARCFTFLCLSLGWDSRLVIDETDHAWTEVYVPTQSRWVHCDPCENAFDTPLMYELGWKKKLSYILAYSPDDVQDVTWRYSTNHKDVMSRRNFCSEAQLLEKIMSRRNHLQQNICPSRKSYLLKRTLIELVELWKEPSAKDDVFKGRQSGSLAWRFLRGETSGFPSAEPYVWKPVGFEIDKSVMRIRYDPSLDKYFRGTHSLKPCMSGWQNGVNSFSNIFRKEEKDWNMVYLAREEGGNVGEVTWSIDLSESGLVVDIVEINLRTQVFENGRVSAVLSGNHSSFQLPIDNKEFWFSTDVLSGESQIKLIVNLKGGTGEVAWQHAQLFRSEINGPNTGLDIIIRLKSAEA